MSYFFKYNTNLSEFKSVDLDHLFVKRIAANNNDHQNKYSSFKSCNDNVNANIQSMLLIWTYY